MLKNDYYCTQYYDWESNLCHRLDFEDNTISEVESDTEIPVEIDPSQSVYFPNLLSQRLKNIVSYNYNYYIAVATVWLLSITTNFDCYRLMVRRRRYNATMVCRMAFTVNVMKD